MINEFTERMRTAIKEAKSAIQKVQDNMKKYYDQQRSPAPVFNPSVMLLENFLQKCSMGYTLYPWISLLEPTLEISYKP